MRILSSVSWILGFVAVLFAPSAAEQAPLSAPALRTHKDFESKHLKNKRTVTVYLPPGYFSDKDQRYPVFYFHDGQNRMQADDKATALIRAGKMRPVILVFLAAIDMETRFRELTYHRWPDKKFPSGDGQLYGRFVTEEVKPFIDKEYRTLPGREHTGVGGVSLGGLMSLDLCRVYPDTFSMCAALSPSLQWANEQIFKDLDKDSAWVKK